MGDRAGTNDRVSQSPDLQPENKLSEKNASGQKGFLPFFLNRKRYLMVVIAFTILGVIGGYAYYALVGCKSGGCAITSNPTMSVIWGGVMGYLLPDFFVKQKQSS